MPTGVRMLVALASGAQGLTQQADRRAVDQLAFDVAVVAPADVPEAVDERLVHLAHTPVSLVVGADDPQVHVRRDHLGHELAALQHRLVAVDEVVAVVGQRVQLRRDTLAHGVDLVQVEDATALGSQVHHAGQPDQVLDAGRRVGVAGGLTEQVEVGDAGRPLRVKIGIGLGRPSVSAHATASTSTRIVLPDCVSPLSMMLAGRPSFSAR